jgi:hypothetical protein
MILWDGVLRRGIARRAVDRPDCALAPHAAFQLRADFIRRSLFHRIGTTRGEQSESKQ